MRLNGHHPTGGVQGSACLCTSPGVSQYLKVSGTIYGGWLSTDGLMTLRLLEPTNVDLGQKRAGYFDLIGSWQGPDLVLDGHSNGSKQLRSGLRIDLASVTLRWNPYWSCKSACASMAVSRAYSVRGCAIH
jgi:hypothetical protein